MFLYYISNIADYGKAKNPPWWIFDNTSREQSSINSADILGKNSLQEDSRNSYYRVKRSSCRVPIMATTACFIIVSRNDIPIHEAEVEVAAKREDASQLHQFILHAALDVVQDLAWTASSMYLKSVDRFHELMVSVYVTAVCALARKYL
ncbi:uncharacterized protein LOC130717267 isoform X2 [Lotus japonicus]|uniref:uncharacterized protein LOC130717267 isoform X2 n=1 Tax=Lotus japonicus TaxID=34305 RepID=UPI00258ADA42|nr:uncharacterized protein LOC130717267 isoform X2 [Lotus japonicus]